MITRRTFLKYSAGSTMLPLFGFDRLNGISEAIAATIVTPHPPIPSALGRPLPDPLYGVTTDNGYATTRLVNSAKNLSKATTTRIVFDEWVPPADYSYTLSKLRLQSYIMGTLLDSFYVPQYTRAQYSARATKYFNYFGGQVDLWEVGNEINGEWLGRTADVVYKVHDAFHQAKDRGLRTALTLYYNPDCWSDPAHEMFTWVENNLYGDIKNGVDYVLISYYEQDCQGIRYSLEHWNNVFNRLRGIFPMAKLGFGELGLAAGESTLAQRQRMMQYYYGMLVETPGYVHGYFWWYYFQQCTPWKNSDGVIKPLWATLNDELRTF